MRLRRRTLVAGAALAVAAGAALVATRVGKPVRTGPPLRPVAALMTGAWDTLRVRAEGSETTIRREGEKMEVIAPIRAPADPRAAAAAFEAIARLDLVAPVSVRPQRQTELGVAGAAAVEVTAGQGDRTILELVLGHVIEGGTMVRLAPGPQIWRATGDLRAIFAKSTTGWRDRAIATFEPGAAEGIEILGSDGARILLAREPRDNKPWRVSASSVPIDRLDPRAPRDLVAALAALQASGFADGAGLTATGLAPPHLTVAVALVGGRTIRLSVGATRGDETFVTIPGGPIFLARRGDVDRISLRPIQFRDKTLCDISEDELLSFRVTRGAGSFAVERTEAGWRDLESKRPGLDLDKIAPLANVFRAWTAPRVAESPPPDAVASPWVTIAGRSRHASCTIRVGRELPDRSGYFVRTAADSEVFVVPKWMIDRIALPIGELRKSGPVRIQQSVLSGSNGRTL